MSGTIFSMLRHVLSACVLMCSAAVRASENAEGRYLIGLNSIVNDAQPAPEKKGFYHDLQPYPPKRLNERNRKSLGLKPEATGFEWARTWQIPLGQFPLAPGMTLPIIRVDLHALGRTYVRTDLSDPVLRSLPLYHVNAFRALGRAAGAQIARRIFCREPVTG